MKPVLVDDKDKSVREQLQEMLDRSDSLSGVVILGHIKGGGEYMRISRMSGAEKAALFAIFQAYITDLFRPEDT